MRSERPKHSRPLPEGIEQALDAIVAMRVARTAAAIERGASSTAGRTLVVGRRGRDVAAALPASSTVWLIRDPGSEAAPASLHVEPWTEDVEIPFADSSFGVVVVFADGEVESENRAALWSEALRVGETGAGLVTRMRGDDLDEACRLPVEGYPECRVVELEPPSLRAWIDAIGPRNGAASRPSTGGDEALRVVLRTTAPIGDSIVDPAPDASWVGAAILAVQARMADLLASSEGGVSREEEIIKTLAEDLKELSTERDELVGAKKSIEADVEAALRQVGELQHLGEELQRVGGEFAELERAYTELEAEHRKIWATLESTGAERDRVGQEFAALEDAYRKLEQAHLETGTERNSLESSLHGANLRIRELEARLAAIEESRGWKALRLARRLLGRPA